MCYFDLSNVCDQHFVLLILLTLIEINSLVYLFTPQPLAARGIVMIMTDRRASGGRRATGGTQFCPSYISVPNIQSDSKSIRYVAQI